MKADTKFYVTLAVLLTNFKRDKKITIIWGIIAFVFSLIGLALHDWFIIIVNMIAVIAHVWFYTKHQDLEQQIHQEIIDWDLRAEALSVGLPLNEKLLSQLHAKTPLENRTPEN